MLGCPITIYAVIVPLCSLKMGALRRKYTLNLKMLFLLIREATIICSQYSVSVTLNYAVRAFYVCRLEERGLLSACLASCVLSNIYSDCIMSNLFQQYFICLFPEIYTILGQKRTAIVLLSFRRRYFTMGIVKIYNVLGGFYVNYSITCSKKCLLS